MISLSKNDLIEIIRLSKQDGLSSRQIAEIYGCGKTTINDFLSRRTHNDFWEAHDDKPIAEGSIEDPDWFWGDFSGNRYVFTCAQNNTHVHEKFLASLKNYCNFNSCELVVGAIHYNKNRYQKHDDADMEYWFDSKIRDHIISKDTRITDDLVWCGSIDIIPTAVNPLSGFHSYTKSSSGIFPHTKVQLESIPTHKFDPAKFLYTTGSVTQRNYIQRKTGQIASFHHVYGALVVEVDDDGDWFVRQLIADESTGEFYDLDKLYTPRGVEEIDQNIEAVNWGDIHAEKLDKAVAKGGWDSSNENNLLDVLKPRYQFIHDVFDMKRRNHHNIKNHYFRFEMHVAEEECVREEVKNTTKVISSMKRPFSELKIVQSNHDLALKRWLQESNFKEDPVNAEFYLELQLAIYGAIRNGDSDFDVFPWACRLVNEEMEDVDFLKEDESFIICGDIECGQHGHNGNNGGRGSVRAFQIQSKKYNVGHAHSASIKDGVYVAGVSGELDMKYNVGGSSWSHSHIITYKNGKRAMITMKDGKWHA